MPLLPLHQDYLSHHQRGDEDQHHLRVHGLVASVLRVQALVLHPVEEDQDRDEEEGGGGGGAVKITCKYWGVKNKQLYK